MKKVIAAVAAGVIVLTPTAEATAATVSTSVSSHVAYQAPTSSVAQQQAIRKARSYLRYQAFSRSGLIAQLKYEGFSTAHATRAVDFLKVDWNRQAEKKARSYLRYQAFSRSGLIAQLKYEGFTASQARYGVRSVGL